MSDFRARGRARGRHRQNGDQSGNSTISNGIGRSPGVPATNNDASGNGGHSTGIPATSVWANGGQNRAIPATSALGNGGNQTGVPAANNSVWGNAGNGTNHQGANGGARPKTGGHYQSAGSARDATLAQGVAGMNIQDRPGGSGDRGRGRGVLGAMGREGAPSVGRGNGRGPSEAAGGLGGLGRGMVRGRRRGMDEYKISCTRPQHVKDTKCGCDGRPVSLINNHAGRDGRPVSLISNHAGVSVTGVAILYQYHVDFAPDIEAMETRHQLLCRDHRDKFGAMRPIFDGSKCITRVHFPDNVTEFVSPHPVTGEIVKITLKFINELPKGSPEFLHITNVMLRNFLKKELEMTLMGRNYYSTTVGKVSLNQFRIEILSGYETSILQFEHGLNLEIDLSHKILRTDTALQVLSDVEHRVKQSGRGGDIVTAMREAVTGQIVMTKYNNKTYRVKDFDMSVTPQCTFMMKGEEVSYMEYFSQRYAIRNLDPNQGMLMIDSKQYNGTSGKVEKGTVYLPPQVCFMTGLTDEIRNNFHTMREIANHTRIGPQERYTKLKQFLPKVNKLTAYGYNFDNELLQVQGRQITDVTLVMGKGKTFGYDPRTADWSREMRGLEVLTPIPIKSWLIVCSAQNQNTAQTFAQSMQQVCRGMGVNLAAPQIVAAPNPRDDSIITTLRRSLHPDFDVVCIILPSSRKSLYDAVKKFCCIQMPVSSQCVISKTLERPKGLLSVVTKIGLQIQAKVGGELWHVRTPKLPPMMVIGIDTYHDGDTGRSDKEKRSAVGLVASMTNGMTRYYSQVQFQDRKEEIVRGLHTFIVGAVNAYHAQNKCVPAYIFVYRDGVGDGQLDVVKDTEISHIEDAFKSMNLSPPPKLTYIIVKKRINTRFFAPINRQEVTNPQPGTIVDNSVTRPEWYDFFVVSQSVRQGTVTPTHYNVIRDDSQWPPDRVQKLSYWLTHLYYNWPGTIRVPAPCMYAHKIAFLHGQSLHEPSHPSLANKLFYL